MHYTQLGMYSNALYPLYDHTIYVLQCIIPIYLDILK
jgi:hypothetical protein